MTLRMHRCLRVKQTRTQAEMQHGLLGLGYSEMCQNLAEVPLRRAVHHRETIPFTV